MICRFFFLLSLAGIVVQSFGKLVILVNFQLNQTYIAKNLCEQKGTKGNHCQGKCHLSKQLTAEDEKPAAQSVPDLKEKFESSAFVLTPFNKLANANNTGRRLRVNFRIQLPPGFTPSVFHPPSTFST